MVNYKGIMDRLSGVLDVVNPVCVGLYRQPVNSVSYSVLTPSPDLDIDEVRVSYSTCMTITVEEEVTAKTTNAYNKQSSMVAQI